MSYTFRIYYSFARPPIMKKSVRFYIGPLDSSVLSYGGTLTHQLGLCRIGSGGGDHTEAVGQLGAVGIRPYYQAAGRTQ